MNDTTNKKSEGRPSTSKRINARRIATYAMYFAIIFIAFNIDSTLSFLGILKFAIITLATVTTLVLFSQNYLEAALVGAFFGISSLIANIYFPNANSPYFLNPLVSVLPRIMVGLASFTAFRLMRKITAKSSHSERISAIVAAAVAPIVNTTLVLTALSIANPAVDSLLLLIKGVLVTNFVPEFLGCVILTPILAPSIAKPTKIHLGGVKPIK